MDQRGGQFAGQGRNADTAAAADTAHMLHRCRRKSQAASQKKASSRRKRLPWRQKKSAPGGGGPARDELSGRRQNKKEYTKGRKHEQRNGNWKVQ